MHDVHFFLPAQKMPQQECNSQWLLSHCLLPTIHITKWSSLYQMLDKNLEGRL